MEGYLISRGAAEFPDVPHVIRARMAKIRKRDTKPELVVRRCAHRLGYRFRLHRADLPGTPDLVFPALRKVILVNGCFWHQHRGCRNSVLPKTRPEFWLAKLNGNVERDIRNVAALKELGWKVLTIWECEVDNETRLSRKLLRSITREQSA